MLAGGLSDSLQSMSGLKEPKPQTISGSNRKRGEPNRRGGQLGSGSERERAGRGWLDLGDPSHSASPWSSDTNLWTTSVQRSPVEAQGTSSTRPFKCQRKWERDFLGHQILRAEYFEKLEVPMVVGFVFFGNLLLTINLLPQFRQT